MRHPGDPSPTNEREVTTAHFESVARRRLDKSGYPALRRLSCHCDGKRLYIRGWVPNYYHKQLAQANLADLGGQIEIVNETYVSVKPPHSSETAVPQP